MSAVLSTPTTPYQAEDPALARKINGAERSYVEFKLNSWGEYIWTHRHYEGYPSSDVVAGFLDGSGGGTGRDRILCKDPPEWFYRVHLKILLMPEDLQISAWVEYVPSVREDGTTWTAEEKRALLGLTERGYRDRLQRVRLRFLGLVG